MSGTLTWASELAGLASQALTGLEDVTVTADLTEVPSALAGGHLVVAVRPPSLEVPGWREVIATWEVYLIAGPAEDQLSAWERLDSALFHLLDALDADEVRPDAFTDLQNATYPAFVLTTTSHHTR